MAKKKEDGEKAPEAVEKQVEPIPIGESGLKKIKVTQEQLDMLQKECKLVGYDPATQIALIK